MRDILVKELEKLKDIGFKFDGDKYIFNKAVSSNSSSKDTVEYRILFEDYIVHPYKGFDFHDKFNAGKKPPLKEMFGIIQRETEKMYYFVLHDENMCNTWCGWCPKKSCKIEEIN